MYVPGLSLLVSALFRWPCSISIHLSPRSVIADIRPFPLAMRHFYYYQTGKCQGISMLSKSVRLVGGQRFRLKSGLFPFVSHFVSFLLVIVSALLPFSLLLSPVLSPFLLVIVSTLCPFCFLLFLFLSLFLSPFLLVIVSSFSLLFPFVSLLVGHCVRLVFLLFRFVSRLAFLLAGHSVRLISLLSSFVSGLVSLLLGYCVRLVSLLSPFVFSLLLAIVSGFSPFCLPSCFPSCSRLQSLTIVSQV